MLKLIPKIAIVFFFFFFIFLVVCLARTDVEITPHVIDEKLKPRDIRKFDIKIKNNSDHKASFYAFVNDIDSNQGKQEFSSSDLDPSISLAKWIQIKRGVLEAMPGEEISVQLIIDVNVNAKPGKKYAVITFSEGSNKYDAKKLIKNLNQPKILINVDISDMMVESAKIKRFETSRNAYIKFPVLFELEVENFGNKEVKPFGSIYIYNKRGKEVGEIKVDKGTFKIEPEKMNEIVLDWSGEKTFGKHKAKLNLEYGDKTKRDLQDTVYFWYFPKYLVLISISILFISVGVLSWIIFKKTRYEDIDSKEYDKEDNNHILDLRE